MDLAVGVVLGSRVAVRVGETTGVFVWAGVSVAGSLVAVFVGVGVSGVAVALGIGVSVGDGVDVEAGTVAVMVEVGNGTVAVTVGASVEVGCGSRVDVAADAAVVVTVPVGVWAAVTIGPAIAVGNGRRVASGGGGGRSPAPVAVGASGWRIEFPVGRGVGTDVGLFSGRWITRAVGVFSTDSRLLSATSSATIASCS